LLLFTSFPFFAFLFNYSSACSACYTYCSAENLAIPFPPEQAIPFHDMIPFMMMIPFAPLAPQAIPFAPLAPQAIPFAPLAPQAIPFAPLAPQALPFAPLAPQALPFAPLAPQAIPFLPFLSSFTSGARGALKSPEGVKVIAVAMSLARSAKTPGGR
jgi:hypothetical protein